MIKHCSRCGQRVPRDASLEPISSRVVAHLNSLNVKDGLDFEFIAFIKDHVDSVHSKRILYMMEKMEDLICASEYAFVQALRTSMLPAHLHDCVLDNLRKFSKSGVFMMSNARYHQLVKELDEKEKAAKLLP